MGGLEEPKSGAILDLNSTTKGGLLLSNVALGNLYTIPYTGTANPFPGVTAANYDTKPVKDGFTGAIVYHTGENGFPAGVYLWNGDNWSPAGEDCRALTADDLTLTGLPLAQVNSAVNFSVSSRLSGRCAEGETFTWSATGPGTVSFIPSSGTTTSVIFPVVGDYTVTVAARNAYMSAPVKKSLQVFVSTDGGVPQTLLDGVYGIVGPVCLDAKVQKQPSTQSEEAFAARVDAFAGPADYTKAYKFVHNEVYSNLNLTLVDPAGLVESMTYPARNGVYPASEADKEKAFTLTFKPDIKTRVPSNGDSLTVKLIATYTNNTNAPKIAYLEIRVEDGTCVCPAKIGTTAWKNFLCHNLGGLDIISSSQLITREHHGDWYRFGAKNASMKNISAKDESTTWDDPYYYNSAGDWPDSDNPCPAGWQVPERAQLGASGNSQVAWGTWFTTNDNPDRTNFSAVIQIGNALFLPVAGWRTVNGGLGVRGRFGAYWSRRGNTSAGTFSYYTRIVEKRANNDSGDYAHNVNAYSVRCIEK
jgi:hypothetical protein